MIHKSWKDKTSGRIVKCVNTEAKKYKVNSVLTAGEMYEVINETEEFLFVIDNTGKVGGYYKQYFEM